jgi:type II secretory pathway component PulF
MKFHYLASQPDGRIVESEIEAKNVYEVLTYLAKNNLKPISIKPAEKVFGGFRLFRSKITLTDQIFISKYLGLMLKIGTGLLEAINILIADFQKTAVKEILLEIRSNLERGNPFYVTFARYPKVFGQVYINLIRAGEVSGNLEKVFEDLTTMLTKNKELREQMRSSLVYPILLLVGSILIMTFLVMFALPKIANVFLESGFEPPVFSKIVFSVGLFLQSIGVYLLIVLVVGAVAVFRFFKNSPTFRKFLLSLVSEIPVVKDLVKKIAIQRFASILASFIRAGIPLTEALEITAMAVGNPELKDALIRISREGLAKGLTVSEAFRKEPFFPQLVVNLVAVSERAGHIENVLETLSDFYIKEIDSGLKTIVSFLEPALLMSIGVVIGGIALAIIIPIYQLTTQF